jgi:hypothetical protein
MRNMTQIFPPSPLKIGSLLDQRVHARRLVCEFDGCRATGQAGKISGPYEEKGG